ncbi:hypothetical protein [Bacteroides pyogenes]|uniref:Uncharacterized protein n=1 Tax=Bacteroides pyogenes DSM 20611 = JCM 6294 TaxID=1121100 RepID=W4PLN9_9BACE|nr:hypothetical protein [Bacteroides pyogenes]GAE20029.1 hypothetical protein JCM6294_3166 [Bacteroides pyogenes DSM 20611 = JCM 6294]
MLLKSFVYSANRLFNLHLQLHCRAKEKEHAELQKKKPAGFEKNTAGFEIKHADV